MRARRIICTRTRKIVRDRLVVLAPERSVGLLGLTSTMAEMLKWGVPGRAKHGTCSRGFLAWLAVLGVAGPVRISAVTQPPIKNERCTYPD